ncbi:MAG: FAD:protein FMN transferase [Gammaproteobacteria bacterium]|nr:FAD:protein FMN transferase [Gammaproteobacteria bacterium]MDD9959659.1 FAD:protein FMN transferase [Gammaproteobacteria bacterium]
MNEILRRHSFSIAFLILVVGAIFIMPESGDGLERFSGFTMGTSYEIQLVAIPASTSREEISREVAQLLNELDRDVFSTYATDSELSRLNRLEAGIPFVASDHLINVLLLAKQIGEESNGAFDVSVGPLVNLWGFGPGEIEEAANIPGDAEITAALEKVGIENLLIDEARSELRKTSDIYVDLSGIAKGYAVDQIASLLHSHNVINYFIEVGGEIKVSGQKTNDLDWVPAIEAPRSDSLQVYEVLSNRGERIALAGSGDYRNFFESGGIRYSHEIDPRTGRPVTHNLAAAYVIDESAAVADAYATSFMILGLEQSRALSARNGIHAFLIYRLDNGEFDHYISPGFVPYVNN